MPPKTKKRKDTPASAGRTPSTGTGRYGKGGGGMSSRRASPSNELDLMAIVTSPGAAQVLLSLGASVGITPKVPPPSSGGGTGGSTSTTNTDRSNGSAGKGTGGKSAGSNGSAGTGTKRKRGDNEEDDEGEGGSGRLNTDYKNEALRAILYLACK